MISSTQSNLNIAGYPGNHDTLEEFIPNHEFKRFSRYVSVSESTSTQYFLNRAWIWGGESGGAYYRYDADTGERQVAAVHTGGETGCWEAGRRVTQGWVDDYRALRGEVSSPNLSPWTDPRDHDK